MMVEQLGLAMMPPCPYLMPFMASAFTSGITSGTPSAILKAELLSTTCNVNKHNLTIPKSESCEEISQRLEQSIKRGELCQQDMSHLAIALCGKPQQVTLAVRPVVA